MKSLNILGENRFETSTKSREACRGIVIKDNTILLTYEVNTDQWFIPGGGLENGENPAECCTRELAEETGYVVKPDELFLTIHEYYEEWHFISHYFVCELVGETERNLTERELSVGLEPRWVPLQDAIDIFSKHNDYAAENEMKRGAYLREYQALLEYTDSKRITIKPLTAELNADYLDFFDNRAFTDNNPNGPCYCTSPNQSEEDIKQMVSEFKLHGVKETVRNYAVKMLHENKIQGYLAYDKELSIGWCNAADMESYLGFVPKFAKANACGKTISIVCFEIAPEYRGLGIASAFIDKICSDAKTNGYVAVEGYANISDKHNDFDFHGPMRLYQKAGFTEVVRENGQVVMRKML